jgi:2,4-dienoyl-CoA reductase-like NADH-dependent reductase (Old Yellow Enzyme family)
MNKQIFESITIGNVKLRNRILRSATHEGMTDENGQPTDKLIELYKRMAKGGIGGIVTGYAGIQQDGKSPLRNMLMIDSDEKINRYKKLADEIHKEKTPIFLQIAHCGRATSSKVTGKPVVAPSSIKDGMYEEIPVELDDKAIEEIIDNFVKAATRAKKAGFDGVQLHVAHGYLLSQFLSSYSNRRNDKWGGSTENKTRIIKEIISRIKKSEPDYPVFVKMNGYDRRKNGMRVAEAVQISRMLEDAGCDAIEVSCGFPEDGFMSTRGPRIPFDAIFSTFEKYKNMSAISKYLFKFLAPLFIKQEKEIYSYNVNAAYEIKKAVSIPVIAVGGIQRVEDIENAIINKKLDAVSICRPLIIEPDLVNKFKEGKSTEAKCIKCNYCILFIAQSPLKCYYGKLPKQIKA